MQSILKAATTEAMAPLEATFMVALPIMVAVLIMVAMATATDTDPEEVTMTL